MSSMTYREFDALVAEKVMEWERRGDGSNPANPGYWRDAIGRSHEFGWSPSTNIADAWEVVRHLGEKGWNFRIFVEDDGDVTVSGWAGDPMCSHKKPFDPSDGHGYSEASEVCADTAPRAICLAALEARGVEVTE